MSIKHYINQILLGDCVQVLAQLPDESVDLIVADPPYFMQTAGDLLRIGGQKFSGVDDAWDKFANFTAYDEFCQAWLAQCRRVLKKDGSIWVMGSFQNIYRLGYLMQNLGFWLLNDVIWHKNNPVPNFAGKRFCNAHETLLWCSKSKNSRPTFNYKTMKHLNGDKQDKSVWTIPLCTGKERLKAHLGNKAHATQKPEQLLYKIIVSSSKPSDVILDPFFGTGTTGVVALRLGRAYIGIEREDRYINLARQRLEGVCPDGDAIANLALETKPPKVAITMLLAGGYLRVGEGLFNQQGKRIGELLTNGQVSDGSGALSIHKMSAKYLNKINHNGWDYFFIKREGALVALNALRYAYAAKQTAGKQWAD